MATSATMDDGADDESDDMHRLGRDVAVVPFIASVDTRVDAMVPNLPSPPPPLAVAVEPHLHLFGLSDDRGLNGRPVRILSKGRVKVHVELLGLFFQLIVHSTKIGRRATAEQVANVFSSHDLSLSVLLQLVPFVLEGGQLRRSKSVPPDLTLISRLAGINKAFALAVGSDVLWRKLCDWRWRRKWGFGPRMRRWEQSEAQGGPDWQARYREEEGRGRREGITPEELHALIFDFRFWLQFPPDAGGYMETGLFESLSRRARLVPFEGTDTPPWVVDATRQMMSEAHVACGRVLGHPNGDEPAMVWYLDADGRGVQWGYLGQLWPKGSVQRTPSWGWQICNRNVVLRSLDYDADLAPPEQSEDDLWGDLLDSLMLVQARGNHLPNGKGTMRVPATGIPGVVVAERF